MHCQRADSSSRDASSNGCESPRMARQLQGQRACSPLRGAAGEDRYASPPPRPMRLSLTPPPAPTRCRQDFSSLNPPPAHKSRKPVLLQEIEMGSVRRVQELLAAGNSSLINPGFEPTLCCAARCGAYPEMFRLLLRHGADVNETNESGNTALDLLCAPSEPLSWTWLDFLQEPTALPPRELSSFRSEEPMRIDSAQITPSVLPPSGPTIEAGVSVLLCPERHCVSATPSPLLSAVSFPMDAQQHEDHGWRLEALHHGQHLAEVTREYEERSIEATRVVLAAGAVVRHEALAGAGSQHHPHGFSRIVRLLRSYAAVRTYRILGRQVVRWAACAHGTLLGQTLGDEILLRHVCSFLAPGGCCFWTIQAF